MKNTSPSPVALITGAARRIGAGIAQYLHASGFSVIIHYHHSKQAAEALTHTLNKKRPLSALSLCADLSQVNDILSLINQAIHWFERLDVLINNASLFQKTPSTDWESTHWETLFNVNVKAPMWLSRLAYPHLAAQTGAIINITDIHADKPLKEYAVYCQTKAALTMQTKVFAKEFAPAVRVNAIAPGAIEWPEKENNLSEEQKQKIINKTPLKCHGEPQFIAQAVLSLINNPFITGQILAVDGGRSLES